MHKDVNIKASKNRAACRRAHTVNESFKCRTAVQYLFCETKVLLRAVKGLDFGCIEGRRRYLEAARQYWMMEAKWKEWKLPQRL